MEKWMKKRKKLSVIVEFHKTNEMSACMDEVQRLAEKHRKCPFIISFLICRTAAWR
jgi:hypothetical protein